MYLSNNSSSMCPEEAASTVEEAPTPDTKLEVAGLQKTRSCDDIVAALEHSANSNRRLSDTTIALDHAGTLEHIQLQQMDSDSPKTMSEPIMNGTTNGHCTNGPAVLETTSLDEPVQAQTEALVNGNTTNGINENGINPCNETEDDEDSDIHVLVKESVNSVMDLGMERVGNGHVVTLETNGHDVSCSATSSRTLEQVNGESTACDSNLQTVKSSSTKTLTGSQTSLDQAAAHALGLESSTDTIVEDEETTKSKRNTNSAVRLVNGIVAAATTPNGTTSFTNGVERHLSEQKSPINRLKSLESSSSISTSTTDISDSHVHLPDTCDTLLPAVPAINGDCGGFQETLLSMKLPFRAAPLALKLNCSCDSPYSPYSNSRASNTSQGSAPSTPFSSRSSTCPPTPGAESSGKVRVT